MLNILCYANYAATYATKTTSPDFDGVGYESSIASMVGL